MSDYQDLIAREEVVTLAKKLIEQKSISPNDGDCQKIIAEELKEVGFTIEDFSYIFKLSVDLYPDSLKHSGRRMYSRFYSWGRFDYQIG